MAETMGAFRAVYDYVVVDSPPAAAIVDAVVLARYADGIVLVIDSRRSRRRTTRRTIQQLTAIGVPILGFVFNSSESFTTSGSTEYFKERQTLVPGAGRLVP
jgi:Mrp family chromosome partitioning ATPase